MKEYLTKMKDGSYKLIPSKMGNDDIEIPEGATAARLCDDVEFYKNDFGMFFSRTSGNWLNTISPRSMLMKNIVWQRAKQREELPFVDDNKLWAEQQLDRIMGRESLSDQYYEQIKKINDACASVFKKQDDLLIAMNQYAEIERVRKEAQAWSNRPVGRCRTVPIDAKPNQTTINAMNEADALFADAVNHPSHYAGEIECIDAMEAMLTPEQFIGYLRGNAFKYQWRYENKGGITDLEKAQWYLNKLISRIG